MPAGSSTETSSTFMIDRSCITRHSMNSTLMGVDRLPAQQHDWPTGVPIEHVFRASLEDECESYDNCRRCTVSSTGSLIEEEPGADEHSGHEDSLTALRSGDMRGPSASFFASPTTKSQFLAQGGDPWLVRTSLTPPRMPRQPILARRLPLHVRETQLGMRERRPFSAARFPATAACCRRAVRRDLRGNDEAERAGIAASARRFRTERERPRVTRHSCLSEQRPYGAVGVLMPDSSAARLPCAACGGATATPRRSSQSRQLTARAVTPCAARRERSARPGFSPRRRAAEAHATRETDRVSTRRTLVRKQASSGSARCRARTRSSAGRQAGKNPVRRSCDTTRRS